MLTNTGILSSTMLMAAGGGPPQPGDGDYFYMDFINEIYKVDGSPVALSSIIEYPAQRTANGLEIRIASPGSATANEIIGAALTKIQADDWTLFLEVEELDGSIDYNYYLWMIHVGPPYAEFSFERYSTGTLLRIFEWGDEGTNRITTATTGGIGIHRFACSHTKTKLAGSIDGRATIIRNYSYTTTRDWGNAVLGGDSAGPSAIFYDHNIRKVSLSPLYANDTDLAILSGPYTVQGLAQGNSTANAGGVAL